DFEGGAWIHRIKPKPAPTSNTLLGIKVPQHIWDYSATMLSEARKIAQFRSIDAVLAPIWDCEGAAFMADRKFALITCLQTTLKSWLESHGHRMLDTTFMAEFVKPMMSLERRLMQESDRI